jgi:hypothetical protein
MDYAETLTVVAKVAGIGGIALGVLALIFREVIRKNIFPQLGNAHAYRIIRLMILLTFAIALISVVAWLTVQIFGAPTPQRSALTIHWIGDRSHIP